MITGFNTDVTYGGVTYHVQTEDKGVQTPLILSLVYDRGTILAAKRSPYDDLLDGGLDEKVLEARLHRQHKLICAAIKAGRLEDLKKLSAKNLQPAGADPEYDAAAGIPMPDGPPVWDIPFIEDVDVIDEEAPEVRIEAEENVIDAEIVSVIDGPVATAAKEGKLLVKLFGSGKFISGDRKNVNVLVCRGPDESSVSGANVMVKVLGSDFRPIIYHAKADSNGIAAVMVKIPSFRSGRAAILVRAMSGGEEAELRRKISHLE
ncbi:MAG: hypothetical protein IPM63_06170 [Acidobacteriota bacterium]|nr:MAG: hypothetical protein IPM63_06170 [Acidobacteriota bacterium]